MGAAQGVDAALRDRKILVDDAANRDGNGRPFADLAGSPAMQMAAPQTSCSQISMPLTTPLSESCESAETEAEVRSAGPVSSPGTRLRRIGASSGWRAVTSRPPAACVKRESGRDVRVASYRSRGGVRSS
jgi:hypothetical protein